MVDLVLNAPEEWGCFPEIQQNITSVDWLNNRTNGNGDDDGERSEGLQSLSVQQLKFCPTATSEERAILQERTNRLKQSADGKHAEGLNPLAVIALGNEVFGFDLKIIKEFLDVRQVIPIPCCPSHFVGNINFRGEILTLIDIKELLNQPLKTFVSPAKVMVIEVNSLVVGIVVDGIRDTMFLLNPRELSKISNAIESVPVDYLQGTVPYQERSLYIFDLPTLFAKGLITQ
ncbi:chemotaxis protein CheW [Phormidesmis sp. 146-12]